jgi:hypothetical protein
LKHACTSKAVSLYKQRVYEHFGLAKRAVSGTIEDVNEGNDYATLATTDAEVAERFGLKEVVDEDS